MVDRRAFLAGSLALTASGAIARAAEPGTGPAAGTVDPDWNAAEAIVARIRAPAFPAATFAIAISTAINVTANTKVSTSSSTGTAGVAMFWCRKSSTAASQGSSNASSTPSTIVAPSAPSAVPASPRTHPSNSPRVPSKSRNSTNKGPSASSNPAISRTAAKLAIAPDRNKVRALPSSEMSCTGSQRARLAKSWSWRSCCCCCAGVSGTALGPTIGVALGGLPVPMTLSSASSSSTSCSRATSPPLDPGKLADPPIVPASSAGARSATS